MNAVRVYAPNSGQFRRGFTPWNKGTGKGGRKDAAQKGAVGFQPREVVAINPDGTVYRRFKSVEAAKDFFGLRDRHSITHACKGRFLCRGFRLFYGEDYIPWGGLQIPQETLPGHLRTASPRSSQHGLQEAERGTEKGEVGESEKAELQDGARPKLQVGKGRQRDTRNLCGDRREVPLPQGSLRALQHRTQPNLNGRQKRRQVPRHDIQKTARV